MNFYCAFNVRVLTVSATLSTSLSPLAHNDRRLSLHVLRAASFRVRTALSAELLPPLRQTARCM